MMRSLCIIYFCFIFGVPLVCCEEEGKEERDQKLISTFQIVRFPNNACVSSTTGRNGTCYTSAECSDKDGTSAGSCADGFGVCCFFLLTTCGSSTSENNTYWKNPTTTTGQSSCELTVCPVSDEICRLRLDFTTFVITGPSQQSTSQVRRRLGTLHGTGQSDSGGLLYSTGYASNCFLDTFSVTGESPSATPPTICGTNTGKHMYVDADTDRCNHLLFTMADGVSAENDDTTTRGLQTLVTARTWDIAVSQIECTSLTLPPSGCTEYFWGSGTYTLTSYNYLGVTASTATAYHLANQHQRQCMRRERGNCVGCFSTDANGMMISGARDTDNIYSVAGGCCGYATSQAGMVALTAVLTAANSLALGSASATTVFQFGWDCLIIPGAMGPSTLGTRVGTPLAAQTAASIRQTFKATTQPTPYPPQICGHGVGIGIGSTTLAAAAAQDLNGQATNISICTRRAPFMMEFMSDDLESIGSTAAMMENSSSTTDGQQGFSITHRQVSCS